MGAPEGARWRTLKPLSVALAALLGTSALLCLVLIWALRDRLSLVEDGSLRAVGEADDRVQGLGAAIYLVGLVVFVLLIIWTWRASKNLEVLGRRDPTLGPGWAIGAWFIPLANSVLVFLVLRDVWRSGEAAVAWGDRAWKQARVGAALIVWWVLLIAGALASLSLGSASDQTLDTTQEVRDNANAGTLTFGLFALASVAGIVALLAMTRRQEETHDAQVGARRGRGWLGAGPRPGALPGRLRDAARAHAPARAADRAARMGRPTASAAAGVGLDQPRPRAGRPVPRDRHRAAVGWDGHERTPARGPEPSTSSRPWSTARARSSSSPAPARARRGCSPTASPTSSSPRA